MEDTGVSRKLQSKVLEYYEYLWARNRGLDIKELLSDVPFCMQCEIYLSITFEMLQSVRVSTELHYFCSVYNDVTSIYCGIGFFHAQIPLFEDLSDAFYRHISTEVTYAYFRPGDFIAMRGNAGRTVYFIRSGEVRTVLP